jgi:hypothetical protein
MIIAFIFFIHLVFSLVIFTKKWQDENVSSAMLNMGLIVILFAVGWSISGMIAKAIMEPEGLGIYFDRDTFSLTLLTIAEFFFYRMYYKEIFTTEAGTEKQ